MLGSSFVKLSIFFGITFFLFSEEILAHDSAFRHSALNLTSSTSLLILKALKRRRITSCIYKFLKTKIRLVFFVGQFWCIKDNQFFILLLRNLFLLRPWVCCQLYQGHYVIYALAHFLPLFPERGLFCLSTFSLHYYQFVLTVEFSH